MNTETTSIRGDGSATPSADRGSPDDTPPMELDWLLDPGRLAAVWSQPASDPDAETTGVDETRQPRAAEAVEQTPPASESREPTGASVAVEPGSSPYTPASEDQPARDDSDVQGAAAADEPLALPDAATSLAALEDALESTLEGAGADMSSILLSQLQAASNALTAADMAALLAALDALEDTLDTVL